MLLQRYIIGDKLGEGKFGAVYRGQHKLTGETVAIKQETVASQHSILLHETQVLQYLRRYGVRSGIPLVRWFIGPPSPPALVMTFMPHTLLGYIQSRVFKTQVDYRDTIYDIYRQGIRILKQIHGKYVLHRDIKPDNFMMNATGALVLVDFGLATFFKDDVIAEQGIGEPYTTTTMVGTARFASYFVHDGCEYCPRDDFLSWTYIYWYLYLLPIRNPTRRRLPWDEPVPAFDDDDDNEHHSQVSIFHPKNQWLKQQKTWSIVDASFTSSEKSDDDYTPCRYLYNYYHHSG